MFNPMTFSEWWYLHNNRMISLLFWFLYNFIQQQQHESPHIHTHTHTPSKQEN